MEVSRANPDHLPVVCLPDRTFILRWVLLRFAAEKKRSGRAKYSRQPVPADSVAAFFVAPVQNSGGAAF